MQRDIFFPFYSLISSTCFSFTLIKALSEVVARALEGALGHMITSHDGTDWSVSLQVDGAGLQLVLVPAALHAGRRQRQRGE